MKTKEKAIELYYKFYNQLSFDLTDEFNDKCAKQCALIAVDMIDDIYQKLTPKDDHYYFLFELEYWQEVKQEIENL